MCIAFDIDNVITNFSEHIRKYVLEEYNIKFDSSNYYIKIPGLSDDDHIQLIQHLIVDKGDEIQVFMESVEYLEKFYSYLKKPITFITSRSKLTEEMTLSYLRKKLPNIKFDVYFAEEFNKYKLLKGFRYFVDDQEKNLVPAIEQEIIKIGFLVTRPWNEKFEPPKKIRRVSGLREVWEEVLQYEKNGMQS